jgi:hypothetical protein
MKRAHFPAQMINPQPVTRKHSGNRHLCPGQNARSKVGRLGRPQGRALWAHSKPVLLPRTRRARS